MKQTRRPCELYMTRREVGEILGVSAPTLTRWMNERKGPPVIRLDDTPRSRVLYPRAEFDQWIASRLTVPKR